ncbi:glutamate receptor 3-like [Centruroides sculpturatus]|uniref:glutamate receptor 3-like n=1 Tax=Centruroides sculpturatus TaxID=218467 RepID=UPI000C6CD437|nr:glutamate receptor 3-like [Centruroides sculpturatus]
MTLYKKVYDSFQRKPENLFSSTADGVKKLRESNGKYAIFVESTFNEYTSHREPCDTMMVPGTLDTKSYAVASMFNSSISNDRINEALHKLHETGYLNELYDKWWLRTSECARRYSRSLEELYHDSLTIWEVSGVFYILLIGIAVLLGITAAEYFYCSRNSSARRHNSALDETQT